MSAFAFDWLNLCLRWAHLVAGIAWIGTSFYFIALDLSLKRREGAPEGVQGSAWEVHGGGFYHVEKFMVAPPALPSDLIWFKWEAYLTWVTGFALMVVQFYLFPSTWLIDPNVMSLAPWQAIGISVASLAVGWLVYDGLCRSPVGRSTVLLAAATFALVLLATVLYTHVFSARSSLVHVGAFIGTLMAANVFMVIIPNQRKATAALLAGETPDVRYGQIGKQRSVHNTYLTLPVLLLMVSGHYPMLTSHPHTWLLVALIIIGGACARHFLVRHEVGDPLSKIGWALPVIALALAGAIWLTYPKPLVPVGDAVSDSEVLTIAARHCVSCHAEPPTHPAFETPPKGVRLETLEALRRHRTLIELHTVIGRTMPLGNASGMTDEERAKLGAWLAAE